MAHSHRTQADQNIARVEHRLDFDDVRACIRNAGLNFSWAYLSRIHNRYDSANEVFHCTAL